MLSNPELVCRLFGRTRPDLGFGDTAAGTTRFDVVDSAGLVSDVLQQPERFIVASAAKAVLVLPSPVAVDRFDSGLVVHDPARNGTSSERVAGALPLAHTITESRVGPVV